ncbi:hypothetical protein JG687_00011569 [Phytophthora cactorum]|uniref:Uncharacterized protein n=1 Tax=Phytophthora cactorum TaxID=29920 RepID=A0A329SYI5_9STRA|nr:hypothetical protein Pcac1_g20150 [Phytophthora cactorum]KAG2834374.1 hypothetical protein PC112_g6131 [Phytophthora cactorum]KAG2928874.1 hypothetical protein PC114_g2951 [Phytophthora cactorum]KAG2952147.1 hypothetical protein PC117_g3044 [Phytophthora cactorum]KAG3028765.1 hypothetical protein PC120_g4701 [Phytophthora cactorum]
MLRRRVGRSYANNRFRIDSGERQSTATQRRAPRCRSKNGLCVRQLSKLTATAVCRQRHAFHFGQPNLRARSFSKHSFAIVMRRGTDSAAFGSRYSRSVEEDKAVDCPERGAVAANLGVNPMSS